MKKKRILLIIIVIAAVLVIITSVLAVKRNRTEYPYERPQGLSPESVVILFMDALNEGNEDKAYSFETEDQRDGIIENDRNSRIEIANIETKSETDTQSIIAVDFYVIDYPTLFSSWHRELMPWTFTLERTDKNAEWYITNFGF